MSRSLHEIEDEILSLSHEERAILVERLLSAMDDGEDEDVEALWVAEAEHRYQQYRAGKCKARPADEVFEDLRRDIE